MAYQARSAALAELDEPEAAWIAADRAMAAAERADAPLLVAAGAFRLGFVFLDQHEGQCPAKPAGDQLSNARNELYKNDQTSGSGDDRNQHSHKKTPTL